MPEGDLFIGNDIGGPGSPEACLSPIGKRRSRRRVYRRPRSQSARRMLSELRATLDRQLGAIRQSLQQLDQRQRAQMRREAEIAEGVAQIRARLSRLEKTFTGIEPMPRATRRQPLG